MKAVSDHQHLFVLVHGAWCGGWVWRETARFLRAAGHDVFTPTLTGLGERAHLGHPDVDLDTHVQDIVGVLTYENLTDVILVGHSYSGMVITGVAERAPERLKHLIYLDALVPEDGKSRIDFISPEVFGHFKELVRTHGIPWQVPPPAGYPRLTPHPLKTFTQPIRVTNPAAAVLPHTFIHCTRESDPLVVTSIAEAAGRAKKKGWHCVELPANHMPMDTMPQDLARLLIDLAQRVPG